jgi:hypothetical protein
MCFPKKVRGNIREKSIRKRKLYESLDTTHSRKQQRLGIFERQRGKKSNPEGRKPLLVFSKNFYGGFMSSNFGHLPVYVSAALPAPILDVTASGLLDVTGQNSINITGPFAVIFLNSSDNSQCSISLDNGGGRTEVKDGREP